MAPKHAADNVIPFPRVSKTDQQPSEYPETFAKVLALHVREQTRQSEVWAPRPKRNVAGMMIALALVGGSIAFVLAAMIVS